jgi:hypothetical protein
MLRPTLAARLLVLSLVSLILCACEVSAAMGCRKRESSAKMGIR